MGCGRSLTRSASRRATWTFPHTSAKAMDACVKAGYNTFDMADHCKLLTAAFLSHYPPVFVRCLCCALALACLHHIPCLSPLTPCLLLLPFCFADGSAEEIVGTHRTMNEAGAGMGDVVVFTKWCPKPGEMTAEAVEEGVNRSLARMQCASASGEGTGCDGAELHLMQFHWWDYLDPRYIDAIRHLDNLRKAGRFRNLGLTNFDTAHLRVVVSQGVKIATNQVCFSLLDMRPAGDMSEFCLEHDIKLLAFGTVAGGFLTDKWLGKPEPEAGSLRTWSEMKYKRFIDIWSKGRVQNYDSRKQLPHIPYTFAS